MELHDVWFVFRTIPDISFWDTAAVAVKMARFPFMVAFAYTRDETNHFADVLLPEATDLESLQLIRIGGSKFVEQFWEQQGFALRQPAVTPRGEARDFTAIATELARRLGMLEKYNASINKGAAGAPLKGPRWDVSLPTAEAHAPERIWDAVCRAASAEVSDGREQHGLDWWKEHGLATKHYPRVNWYLFPELVRQGLDAGRLQFTSDIARVADVDVVWVTFDTPVNENDEADVESVVRHVEALFPHLANGAVVMISSQVPVGTTARLERSFAAVAAGRRVDFACSPENLRLGKALDVFRKADRIVVGARTDEARARIGELLAPLGRPIQWMRVESAEMTKHAINAFLAASVVFINEIAAACEATGADAKEVERGLKSETRIGPGAYLGPGGAFAGGTLARDIAFLLGLSARFGFTTPLFAGVKQSNDGHRLWARRRLETLLGGAAGKTVAVLGLTYKPNTDTLRRSESVALCHWLVQQGANVRAHDPAIKGPDTPAELPAGLTLVASADEALRDADAVVIATEWPAFRELTADRIAAGGRRPLVLDANRFLAGTLANDARVRYVAVGTPAPDR